MRMRIIIDAVIDFKDRKTMPIINANDLLSRGLTSMLRVDEEAYIEPDTRCDCRTLGKEGRRMITKKELLSGGGR